MQVDSRFVRRVQRSPTAAYDAGAWPYTVPAVAALLRDGLDLSPGVTFLVGENGSGKSTLVEAIAVAFGLNAESGSRHARHATRVSESPLHEALQLVRGVGNSSRPWSFFLRAETMHGFYTYLEQHPGRADPRFHEMSHGEGFLEILRTRFDSPGFYVLDEPESALSFSSCLALVGVLHDLAEAGSQVLCATHSPVLTALPGATILEVGDAGLQRLPWDELALVDHWRRFLGSPQSYLRHVLD